MPNTNAISLDCSYEQHELYLKEAILANDLASFQLWLKRSSGFAISTVLLAYRERRLKYLSDELDLIRLNRVDIFKQLYSGHNYEQHGEDETVYLRVQAARFSPELLIWLFEGAGLSDPKERKMEISKSMEFLNKIFMNLCYFDDVPKASVDYLLKKFKERDSSLKIPLFFSSKVQLLIFSWVLNDIKAETLSGKVLVKKGFLRKTACETSGTLAEDPRTGVLLGNSSLEFLRMLLNQFTINLNKPGLWYGSYPKVSAVDIAAILDSTETLGVLVAHGADISHLSMEWLQQRPKIFLDYREERCISEKTQFCTAMDAFRALKIDELSPADPRYTLVELMNKLKRWGKGQFQSDDYTFLDSLPSLDDFKKALEKADSRLSVLVDLCRESIKKVESHRALFELKWEDKDAENKSHQFSSSLASLIAKYNGEIPLSKPILNRSMRDFNEFGLDAKSALAETKELPSIDKIVASSEQADDLAQTLRELLLAAVKIQSTGIAASVYGFLTFFKTKNEFNELLIKQSHTFSNENLCLAVYYLLRDPKLQGMAQTIVQQCPVEILNRKNQTSLFIQPDDVEYKHCLLKCRIKDALESAGVSKEELNAPLENFTTKIQLKDKNAALFSNKTT